MQEQDINKIVDLMIKRIEEKEHLKIKSKLFKGLSKNKDTTPIRILNDVKVMLVTHCEDRMMTPVLYASRAIAKQILEDEEKGI